MYAWSNGPSSIAQEGLYKSTDGGSSWDNKGPNIGGLFETQIFGLVASATDPNLLFIGGNNFGANGWESMIYRTIDGGENWQNVYMGPENNSFKYLFIGPNSNDQTIYSAYGNQSDHAGFMRSEDGGDTWTDFNAGIPSNNKWGGAIVCDPSNSDILYGGIGGYGNLNGTIYKSIDGGGLWTQTSLNISTYSKISDILISPVNSNVLYAATTQSGVYVSFDAGGAWEAANNGLPAINVTGFSNAFMVNDIWSFIASTFSNSTFETEVAEPGISSIQNKNDGSDYFTLFPNPSRGEISIKLKNKNTAIESVSIYTSQGRLIKYFDSCYFYNPVTKIELELTPNIYLCKIVYNGKVYTSKLVILE